MATWYGNSMGPLLGPMSLWVQKKIPLTAGLKIPMPTFELGEVVGRKTPISIVFPSGESLLKKKALHHFHMFGFFGNPQESLVCSTINTMVVQCNRGTP